MDTEQTATTIAVSSVLAYPTWLAVKAAFWRVIDHCASEVDRHVDAALDDQSDVGVTPMDPALLIDWHTRRPALADDSLAETLASWSTAAATVPAQPNTPEWYAEWDRLLATSPLPVDPETYLDPDDCRLCGGTGLYDVRNWMTGDLRAVTCPSCRGSGERGAR